MKENKPHFYVTAGLIWQDGRVLITRRPEGNHLAGFWEFPGGKKETGETLRECLEREIKEELGIEIAAHKVLLVVHHEYETRSITLNVFHCIDLKGQPKALEGQEIRWVYLDEIKKYTFPPPDLKVIEFLNTKKKKMLDRSKNESLY